MPLTVGGGVRTVEDIRALLLAGADKVSINTAAVKDPEFVRAGGREVRRQCIVVGHRRQARVGGTEAPAGRSSPTAAASATGIDAVEFARQVRRARRRRDPAHLDGPRRHQGAATTSRCTRAISDAVTVPGHRLGRRRHARPSGRRRARGPRQRGAGRLDLPLRHLHHRRGEGLHGQGGIADAAGRNWIDVSTMSGDLG